MQYVVDRLWKWVQCNLVIKRAPHKYSKEQIYQSLQAEVQLISDESEIKNFQLEIQMQKPFQFEQGRGFIWHKSWYIPQIIIKFPSKVNKIIKQQNNIKKLYCQILSGYPFKKDQHYYLEQVKLDGNTLQQFNKKGQTIFSNLKFSETSFNKNKNKFSIIIVIYTSYQQKDKNIIKSYISSPIQVDSRKQARKKISANTFIQEQITPNKFINKLQGFQRLISDHYSYDDLFTINGFIKYYTAANIRFKIKHPYYIGYKFSNLFQLYYNQNEAQNPLHVLDIIGEIQLKEEKLKNKSQQKKVIFNDNKEILKKNCPKILLFLVKTSPRQGQIIKDEYVECSEKNAQSSLIKNENCQQNKEQKNKNENYQQMNQVLSATVVQKCSMQNNLSYILQPSTQNKEKSQNLLFNSQRKQQNLQSINKQGQKIIKQESKSQELCQVTHKSFQQFKKKQQKKTELLKQEDAIKKIQSIFESWKFNFIHLKKSDWGSALLNKKWIYIPPEDLLENFQLHMNKKSIRSFDLNRVEDQGRSINQGPINNYLSYDIHQVIELQKSKARIKRQQSDFQFEI